MAFYSFSKDQVLETSMKILKVEIISLREIVFKNDLIVSTAPSIFDSKATNLDKEMNVIYEV